MSTQDQDQRKKWVNEQIEIIKSSMPETYKSIKAKADELGAETYALVKRGLRGEPNCFWAMEQGYVMGTPFQQPEIARDVAQYMVNFGCAYVCIFRQPALESST